MEALSLANGPASPPLHVAIIMDGNGRWARARGLPRTAGHQRGAETVRTIVEAAAEMGVSILTLFGFSSENWNRPESEVRDLMGLLRLYLRNEIATLAKNGVRLRVIGERARLAPDIVALIEEAEAKTAENRRLTLVIALNYGGRQEIVAAARRLAMEVEAGRIEAGQIDDDMFARQLFTAELPDPDLLIRTSGEQRISNFLLWQMAYTEFVFVDSLWPDFSREEFEKAIREYQGRERRYGGAVG
ncbi:isoprenyl transferase [Shumkonia mesophila]|uniref:isoprenyl transferase n=1 Tax=Shumkonia mesophila TaxID=2838854 RepID=UPI002934870A|nr:isoprenyl transferase [Shumkonia mesophila]